MSFFENYIEVAQALELKNLSKNNRKLLEVTIQNN